MSLKILLADDSMTAQNMGKKILSDAGYEVIAVSNGAAAVKKIAEHRPDLAILDIYMPGYTGLEVCERVKSTLESSRTPVLLTVGKMEPYRPEDGTRVRADGVIVKPFEATDLLAVVEKLAGNLKPAKPAAEAEEVEEPEQVDDAQAAVEAAAANTGPERMEVPQEMQVAPAYGLEEFGIEPVQNEVGALVGESEHEAPLQTAQADVPAMLEFAAFTPAGFVTEDAGPAISTTTEIELEPTAGEHNSEAGSPEQAVVQPFEVEFTSAPQVSVVQETAAIPELEPTIDQGTYEVSSATDPALADPTEYATEFATGFGTATNEEVPVGIIPELETAEEQLPDAPQEFTGEATLASEEVISELPVVEAEASKPEPELDDFEARVAAAMAAYEEPVATQSAEATPEWKIEEAPLAEEEAAVSLEAEMAHSAQTVFEPAPVADEPILAELRAVPVAVAEAEPMAVPEPIVQPEPMIDSEPVVEAFAAAEPMPEPEKPVEAMPQTEPLVEAFEAPHPAPVEVAEVVSETALPEVAPEQALAVAAAAAGVSAVAAHQAKDGPMVDEARIASAIQKALERLKPQLVSEIARELAGDKEDEKY